MKKLILMTALVMAQNSLALECAISTVETESQESQVLWQDTLEESLTIIHTESGFQVVEEDELGEALLDNDGASAFFFYREADQKRVSISAGQVNLAKMGEDGNIVELKAATSGKAASRIEDLGYPVHLILFPEGISASCF